MKTSILTNRIFSLRKTIFLVSIFLLCLFESISGQVTTYVLHRNDIADYIPFYPNIFPKPIILPEVDLEAVLKEDIKNGNEVPRFGIKIPTDLIKSNGEIQSFGRYIVWRKSFFAQKAKSLNFEFENLRLPSSAKMYIYNKSGFMFVGPIENYHIHNGKYSSDIIQGNEIVVQVILLVSEYEQFSINVSNVVFGFIDIGPISKPNTKPREFGDALPCTIDVKCDEGDNWVDERDAVALILVDNVGYCSGALLNTTCQELEGYFLTAQHCVDGATGHLAWTFRFNYDSPECDGDEPESWLTYSGADVISQWATSDFGLLQLDGSVKGQPTLALAGWNRIDYTPNSGVCISHPQADVKKISIDEDALNIEAFGGGTGSAYLKTIWDFGLVEPVSSGGPLFDGFYKRIVGQIRGGEVPVECEDETPTAWSGRFYSSWAGGGTSTTRLSDYVGSASTTSTIESPYIGTVSPGPLCTTNRTYTLNDMIPFGNATWAVTPTNLFATSSGASISGSGTSAVLRAASMSSSGLATLTFTISSGGGGCNSIDFSYQFWVGIPGGTLELEDNNICTTEEGIATILWGASNSLMGVTNTVWSYDGPIDDFSGGPVIAHYSASTSGNGYIYVTRTNPCGDQYLSIPYRVSDCRSSTNPTVQIYPNPASNTVFVSFDGDKYNLEKAYPKAQKMIKIYDNLGFLVLSQSLNSSLEEINLLSLQPGTYCIELTCGEFNSRKMLSIVK